MNQREIDILNLENRILKDRGDLNNLIFQYRQDTTSDALMDKKLQEMQIEIAYVEDQLRMLKETRIENTIQINSKPIQPVMAQASVVQHKQVQAQQMQKRPMPERLPQPTAQNVRKTKDMESVIGKSWMGAIASVLIFISIIMFATLLLPVLTDTIKMLVMYGISIAATVFGLIKLKKDDKSPFYLAVSGCGIGAIYISLILTNFYFKAIDDVTLYLLIAVWAIFVCVLSKRKSTLFQVIGQCGILIAVFFGCNLCCENEDSTKFVILVFFYLITSLIFMWVHYQRELSGNLISLIFNHINAWIILFAAYYFNDEKIVYIVAVIMMLYIAASIGLCFKVSFDKNAIGSILAVFNVFIFNRFMSICIEDDFITGVIKLCFAVVLIGLTEWKFKENNVTDKRILQIAMMFTMVIAVLGMEVWAVDLLLIIISAALLVYGYDRRDLTYQFGSIVIMLLVVLCMDIAWYNYGAGLLYFVLLLALSLWKKEQYSCGIKLCGYIVFFFMLYRTYDIMGEFSMADEMRSCIQLMLWTIVHVAVMKTIGLKDYLTGEREKASEAVFGIINAMLMFVATLFILDVENEVLHLLVILTAGVLFMANSGNLLKRYQGKQEEMLAGIYVGVKLTILLWTSLSSFDAANMVVSIACFILAIVGIMIGFGMHFKSLRVYGLVLSIFSVVKLIMIDVNYDNLLGRAAGFFVCGILCFVISLIYNTIDKNMKKS